MEHAQWYQPWCNMRDGGSYWRSMMTVTVEKIPEHIWEVTYRLPNGDDQWYRTPTKMTFEDACRQAVEGRSSTLKLIRVEKIPTPTTVVGGK